MEYLKERISRIALMGFDVDGTLTDGGLYFGANGEFMKRFCVFDGYGLRQLMHAGIHVAWITARKSEIVTARANDLGITLLAQNVKDKHAHMESLLKSLKLDWNQCGFFGDDWPDFALLKSVGFAATTQTAPKPMQQQAHWLATRRAGDGAARELCDFILEKRQ